jgi:hypothetical protein
MKSKIAFAILMFVPLAASAQYGQVYTGQPQQVYPQPFYQAPPVYVAPQPRNNFEQMIDLQTQQAVTRNLQLQNQILEQKALGNMLPSGITPGDSQYKFEIIGK